MPRKKSFLSATDGFCGAGGSYQGATAAGVEVVLGLNHWKLAIETYATNNPKAMTDCTDISACDPRRYPSTHIGIFSPECTTHSPAGGNKHQAVKKQLELYEKQIIDPATERSRATMWDVCRFAEYHGYELIIIENVIEAKTRWVLFDSWLHAMRNLGYDHKCVYRNSMHFHPTPQSRDRMYIVFWKRGNKAPDLDYMPAAYCTKCERKVMSLQTFNDPNKKFGKYRQQYLYRCEYCTTIVEPYYHAAFNCIDWSDRGKRIGDKPLKLYKEAFNGRYELPLAPNTLKRIEYGRDKYWQPFVINDQHSTGVDFRVKGLSERIDCVTTVPNLKLVLPFLMHAAYSDQARGVVRSTIDPGFTQTSVESQALVNMPFIIKQEFLHGSMRATTTGLPLSTQTGTLGAGLVSPPFMVELKGNSKTRPIDSALSCATTVPYHGIVTHDAWDSFISYYYGKSQATHITDALGTARQRDCYQLISYPKPDIEDCYYRMLKPDEIKMAMAFGRDYKILGSSKNQVKQLGNAVTPPVMEWLCRQGVKSLS